LEIRILKTINSLIIDALNSTPSPLLGEREKAVKKVKKKVPAKTAKKIKKKTKSKK